MEAFRCCLVEAYRLGAHHSALAPRTALIWHAAQMTISSRLEKVRGHSRSPQKDDLSGERAACRLARLGACLLRLTSLEGPECIQERAAVEGQRRDDGAAALCGRSAGPKRQEAPARWAALVSILAECNQSNNETSEVPTGHTREGYKEDLTRSVMAHPTARPACMSSRGASTPYKAHSPVSQCA